MIEDRYENLIKHISNLECPKSDIGQASSSGHIPRLKYFKYKQKYLIMKNNMINQKKISLNKI
jgi:hypothetical protein